MQGSVGKQAVRHRDFPLPVYPDAQRCALFGLEGDVVPDLYVAVHHDFAVAALGGDKGVVADNERRAAFHHQLAVVSLGAVHVEADTVVDSQSGEIVHGNLAAGDAVGGKGHVIHDRMFERQKMIWNA